MSVRAIPYTNHDAPVWDDVVHRSAKGTFQLESRYMDYHRSRFRDASLLFYDEHGRAVGAFPANYDEDGTVVSHAGLTYGGLIFAANAHATDVLLMLDAAVKYYKANKHKRLIYKAIQYIYSPIAADADLYGLTLHGAQILRRTLSTAIALDAPLPFSTLRRRGVVRAQRSGIQVVRTTDFAAYWQVLSDVLHQRHGAKPVHTLDEIRLLHARYPQGIQLYTATESDEVVAGVVVYASRGVAHAQYIAATERGRAVGALDLLFEVLVKTYRADGYRWFDFGISTDHSGAQLNAGLLAQKEGFGGRAVCYDTYLLTL